MGLIGIVIVLSYLLLKNYFIIILNASIFALIFYPIYNWLNKKTNKKYLSSALTILLFILVITIPLLLLLNLLAGEANDVYFYIKNSIKEWEEATEKSSNWAISRMNDFIERYNLKSSLETAIKGVSKSLYTGTFTFILKIPHKMANFFIMLFIIFFLLPEGKILLEEIKKTVPINKNSATNIIKKMKDMVYGVVYGQIVIALVQGILGGFGFYIAGLPNPVLWGMVMSVFAILPFIGASFIWAPGAIYLIVAGITTSTNMMVIKGIGLIIYGLLLIGSIETFVKPKVISKWTKTHPVVILLGILGGLNVFGLMGIIIGPTILSVAILLFHTYVKRQVT